jgi:hypothetical protein
MVQDRDESLQEQLHETLSQLGQHFSDDDSAVIAQELTKYAGVAELSDYNEIFNDLLTEHGLTGTVSVCEKYRSLHSQHFARRLKLTLD